MMKYYKTLFLGLVDMALVNAFIVTKCYHEEKNDKPPSHADFLLDLQAQLVSLRDEDFANKALPRGGGDSDATSFVPTSQKMCHSMCQTNDRVRGGGKRRTRVCKVCSVLSDGRYRKHETTFYCVECSDQQTCPVFLCNEVRRLETGNSLTCFQIWHNLWACGSKLPKTSTAHIRRRTIASIPSVKAPERPRDDTEDDEDDETAEEDAEEMESDAEEFDEDMEEVADEEAEEDDEEDDQDGADEGAEDDDQEEQDDQDEEDVDMEFEAVI